MRKQKLLGVIALLLMSALPALAVQYNHVFAPSGGYVNKYEKPFREEVCLNGYWDFQPVSLPSTFTHGKGKAPELTKPQADKWDKTRIKIPSPWNINDFAWRGGEGPDHRNYPSYPRQWNNVKMAWMKKTVSIPQSFKDKQIFLHFDAVAGDAEVYVNGKKLGENFDLFLPFDVDITSAVKAGETAEVLVGVRSQWLFEDNSTIGRRIVPGGSMWGYTINGIWQDVYLVAEPKVNISNVFVKPQVSRNELKLEITVKNNTGKRQLLSIDGNVREWINQAGKTVDEAPVPNWTLGNANVLTGKATVAVNPNTEGKVTMTIPVKAGTLKYWSPDTPNLYGLILNVNSGKKTIDCKYERFGWREFTFDGTKQLLNGKPIVLKSDSWHFMGIPQMSRRYAWAWYTAIKQMNSNAVRLHAMVYPHLYQDMADEMGICILDETANWASDGGPKLDSPTFWQHSREHLHRFVERDRNHPSVFGWSISNENKPVILYVFKRPDLMPQQKAAWQEWRDIVKAEDPTRPWISSDGEDDGEGILPVTVGHYGDMNSMKRWRDIGKPWGIGETSMAYYGTPKQVAAENGQRAYESMEGRMEGIAHECYKLIKEMRQMGASYTTVFNMVWYGLKPLPLGKKDTSTMPNLKEGIFFPDYVEGQPGVQPERIGPYSTTLNPGYDPSLPLYEKWPMYDALKAANADDNKTCKWASIDTMQYVHKPLGQAVSAYKEVVFVGDANSALYKTLTGLGVSLTAKCKKPKEAIVIADLSKKLSDEEIAELDKLSKRGASLWLCNAAKGSEKIIKQITGQDVMFDKLKRSSFLPVNVSWMSGLNNSDFYFCEVQKTDVCNTTMHGSLVDNGEVLLNACRTDWRAWNFRPEEIKTAAVLRSELQCKSALPVFVRNGNVWISTPLDFASTAKGSATLAAILRNAGISTTTAKNSSAVNNGIKLEGADKLLLDPSVDTSKKTK